MKPLMVPKWFDSIRSILALVLTITLCVSVFTPDTMINKEEMTALKELTMLALTFYFLKQRSEQNGGGQPK